MSADLFDLAKLVCTLLVLGLIGYALSVAFR